jgi:beta-lactamase superfamily II metal-dependent hydrolase
MVECLNKYMPLADRDIELMFATHPDADHIGGLTGVIRSYRVLSFESSGTASDTKIFKKLMQLIAEQNVPHRIISAGDRYKLTDGVILETIWPKVGFTSEDTNEHSLVQIVRFGDFAALLTGDITYQILDGFVLEDSFQVMKLAHHGSKTGTDDETFKKIKTAFAVISDGKNNPYHHPHPSVLNVLNKYKVPFKRTDEVGTIEIITDGKTTKVLN